jgi:hypothetical protein
VALCAGEMNVREVEQEAKNSWTVWLGGPSRKSNEALIIWLGHDHEHIIVGQWR